MASGTLSSANAQPQMKVIPMVLPQAESAGRVVLTSSRHGRYEHTIEGTQHTVIDEPR